MLFEKPSQPQPPSPAALFTGHLWGQESLKNDAIAAAGTALLALAALRFLRRGQIDGMTAIALTGGVIFACVKFSGPPIVFAVFLIAAVMGWRQLREVNGRSLAFLAAALLLLCATSGVYYLRNLIEFHNPLYPFALTLGPLTLPGALDHLSGTRIADHLLQAKTWQLFFPGQPFSPRRTAFAMEAWFALFLLVPLWLAWWRLKGGTRGLAPAPAANLKALWACWLLALALWLLFLHTAYTAGFPGDAYYYLSRHGNFRYAITPMLLMMILAVAWLCSLGPASRVIGIGLLLAETLGRAWFLFDSHSFRLKWLQQLTEEPGAQLLLALAGAIAALVALSQMRRRTAGWGPPLGAALFLLLTALAAPWIYERNQDITQRGWQALAMDEAAAALAGGGQAACSAAALEWLIHRKPTHIFPYSFNHEWPPDMAPLSVNIMPNAFAATGSHRQCEYLGTTNTRQVAEDAATGKPQPTFIVATTHHRRPITEADAARIASRLRKAGYHLAVRHPYAVVYQRQAPPRISP